MKLGDRIEKILKNHDVQVLKKVTQDRHFAVMIFERESDSDG